MKVLHGARFQRLDVVFITCKLAKRVSKWNQFDDLQLLRMMSYLHSTPDLVLKGHVGDPPERCRLVAYADSDFAACPETANSTSGVFVMLEGPNTSFPLVWSSRRQGSVSKSTPEAEIIALEGCVRSELLPLLTLWSFITHHEIGATIMEDNEACISICNSGYSSCMRHLSRTHRVNVAFLSQTLKENGISIEKIESELQRADPFTKTFAGPAWQHALALMGLVNQD